MVYRTIIFLFFTPEPLHFTTTTPLLIPRPSPKKNNLVRLRMSRNLVEKGRVEYRPWVPAVPWRKKQAKSWKLRCLRLCEGKRCVETKLRNGFVHFKTVAAKMAGKKHDWLIDFWWFLCVFHSRKDTVKGHWWWEKNCWTHVHCEKVKTTDCGITIVPHGVQFGCFRK